jgi:hypothetical protein
MSTCQHSGCPEKEGEWPESIVEYVLGKKMNLDKNFNIVRAFRMDGIENKNPLFQGNPYLIQSHVVSWQYLVM